MTDTNLNRGSNPDLTAHVAPCNDLVDLQAAVAKLPTKGSEPVSPRMLALVIVLCVTALLAACAWWKVLPGEAVAATIGMLAGRLTSNIGGPSDAPQKNA